MNARPEDSWAPLPEVPLISVVMPVRNEERFIEETLDQVLGQDYPKDRFEVLVCDGMSDDRTRDIVSALAESDPRVRLIDNPGRRSGAGRNAGFRNGRGDVFVVIDGHVHLPNNQLLASIAHHFRESGAACLGRPQPLIAKVPGSWSESISIARGSGLGHSTSSFIFSDYEGPAPAASNGAAYRREVFETVGYVDEHFDACEDLEFNTRIDEANLSCVTSPSLTVQYFARDNLRGLFKQMHRYGYGRYKYLRVHPSAFSIAQLVPAAFVLGVGSLPLLLIASLFAAPWIGPAGTVLRLVTGLGFGLTSIYALTVALVSMRLAARTSWKHFPRLLAVFPTIHAGLGAGFLGSLFKRGRLVRHGQQQPA